MIAAAEEMRREQTDLFKSVSLSSRTTSQNVQVLGRNSSSQNTRPMISCGFPRALDESTDATVTV